MQSIHNERLRRNKVKAIERKSNKYICDTKYTRTKHFLLDQVIVFKVRMFQGNTEDDSPGLVLHPAGGEVEFISFLQMDSGVCSSGSNSDSLCQYSFSPIERLFKRKSSNISDTYILYLNI